MPVPHHSVFTGRMPFLPPSMEALKANDIQKYTRKRNHRKINYAQFSIQTFL